MKKILGRFSVRKKAQGGPERSGSETADAHIDSQRSLEEASTSFNGILDSAAHESSMDPSDPLVGTRYRKLRYLKNEGMGQIVVLAVDRETGQQVVVKLLERGPNVSNKVEPEIVRHFRCKGHPNIIQLRELFLTPKHLAIVMEYAQGGDLRETIRRRGRLPEAEARWIMQQVLSALRLYHAVGMTKRDLRMENVLLCGDSARPLVKLCDFAYSKTEQVNSDPKSALGTLVYTAPEEILVQSATDDRAADVWSSGILLYAMLVGTYPFGQLAEAYDQKQVQEMLTRIMKVQYDLPAHLSPGARELLQRILVSDQGRRATLQEICEHPWIAQDTPPNLWRSVTTGEADAAYEEQLRGACRDAQRPLTSTISSDIDQLADEIMDMDECEATFDDLDLRDAL